MTKYRVQSPGAYLVKDGEKVLIGQEKDYTAEELNGWRSPSNRLVVTDKTTGEVKQYFPGEPVVIAVPKKKSQSSAAKKKSQSSAAKTKAE